VREMSSIQWGIQGPGLRLWNKFGWAVLTGDLRQSLGLMAKM